MEFIYKEEDIDQVATELLKTIGSTGILCFYGSMGAGKTTLIKAIVQKLGAEQAGNSPTFGIVNEYSNSDGSLLGYHFDFYRIEDEKEALDIGLEDYLAQDVWIFMEWPEKINNLIPGDAIKLNIEVLDKLTRKLSITA